MGKGKNYTDAAEKIDKDRTYPIREAVETLRDVPHAKFDETVEVHIRLGIDPRKADQQIRGTVSLPHGSGKSLSVAVFAQGDKAREAEEAGADHVGAADLAEKVEGGWTDFDAAVATPDMMATVGKLGKILGPRGLMPNPKSGTVTFEVGKAVKDIKSGKVEYRTDRFGIIHAIIGKVSFSEENLVENYRTFIDEIMRAKPPGAKGRYIRTISMATTMSPGIRLEV